jgi:hypothetical protein
VEAELFLVDKGKDGHLKLIGAFENFAKAPKI